MRQHKDYGKQAIQKIEKAYPSVQQWKLDTPAENHSLRRFTNHLDMPKRAKAGTGKAALHFSDMRKQFCNFRFAGMMHKQKFTETIVYIAGRNKKMKGNSK